MYRVQPSQSPQNIVPKSKILHSLRSLRSSSNSLASIWRLLFFFSSSSPSCILWQAPIIRCEDRRIYSRDRFAHQLEPRYSKCLPTPALLYKAEYRSRIATARRPRPGRITGMNTTMPGVTHVVDEDRDSRALTVHGLQLSTGTNRDGAWVDGVQLGTPPPICSRRRPEELDRSRQSIYPWGSMRASASEAHDRNTNL